MAKVLIVDDNPSMCLVLAAVLENHGYDVQTAADGVQAQVILAKTVFDVVITDIGMPTITGIDLLKEIMRIAPDTSVLLMTGLPSVDTATKALQGGAFDYLLKPISTDDIMRAVRRAVITRNLKTEKRRLEYENTAYRQRLEQTVEKKSVALRTSEARLEGILAMAPVGIYVSNGGIIRDVNPAFCDMLGYSKEELVFNSERMLHRSDDSFKEVQGELNQAIATSGMARLTMTMQHKNGSTRHIHLRAAPMHGHAARNGSMTLVAVDMTDQLRIQAEREQEKSGQYQTRKMESLGRLAAGIAHEINAPSQFVTDNVIFVNKAIADLGRFLTADQELRSSPAVCDTPLAQEVDSIAKSMDLAYLLKEIPKSLQQSLAGMDRIKTIVAAMSEYSHPSTEILAPVDLNHLIEITLTMCRSEWKNVAMVRLQLDKALPLVPCMSGEISQVLINLIVNAAHAIADVLPSTEGGMGVIVISTAVYADWVVISITDTGSGIPLAIRDQIFEPQFTAKGIGNGTGQGLALAWSVVVDKHHGTITFDSEIGEGTTFRIRLPLHGTPAAEDLVHPALTANRTIILSGQEETQRHVAKTHAQLR